MKIRPLRIVEGVTSRVEAGVEKKTKPEKRGHV